MPSIEITSDLKGYRLKAGWTQEELANRLNVTRQTINAIEQGKYQPTLFLAWQSAKLFKVSIEDIFTFK
jgi:putative transcriptional regulator